MVHVHAVSSRDAGGAGEGRQMTTHPGRRGSSLGYKRTLATLVLALALAAPDVGRAQGVETPAKQAILLDIQSGTTLFEKNADDLVPPASMSKLMTIYMVFERLKEGTLKLSDTFLVSERAWRMGGSKTFVQVGARVSVEDLLRGIIVQSGNDACIVVAEGLAGSERKFGEEMTARARKLGLTRSVFKNSTGWPEEGHVMSAREIALISQRLIEDFPDYYKMFSEIDFTYNNIKQGNRNPLLYGRHNVDGLKTGHTDASGYGLAASSVREARRLILVVNGLQSMNQRAQETARLLDLGYREFESYALFKKGDTVETADVWLGTERSVPLVIEQDLKVTLFRKARRDLKVSVAYNGPIAAPIAKGAAVARLVVTAPGLKTMEVPLVAGSAVERLGLFGRLNGTLRQVMWGNSG